MFGIKSGVNVEFFFVRQDTVPLGFGLKFGISSLLRFEEMQLFKSLLTKLVVLGI